jgi:hypothetical protein
MTETKASACGTCGKDSLIPLRSAKWGRCSLCITLAVLGAVTGWSFSLSFWLVHPDPRVIMACVGTAACFTIVLVLHLIAYRREQAVFSRARETSIPSTPATSPRGD